MGRDGRIRRRTTVFPNDMETDSTTDDYDVDNSDDLVAIIKGNEDSLLLKRLLKHEMLHGPHSTPNDNYPYRNSYNSEQSSTESIATSTTTTTTRKTEKSKPKNRGRFIYQENFDPQDDTVGLVEQSLPHFDDNYRAHPRYPNIQADVPQQTRNWKDLHPHKDRHSWPVGTVIITVFLVGVFCLFVFSRVMAWREYRRPMQSNPRPARARRSTGSAASCGRARDEDDDGGFTDENRRRIAHAGSRVNTPPRLVTPPPPYPGSPTALPLPSPAVYVNPLDKPQLPSGSRETSTIQAEELPPPYPGWAVPN